jgi:hypothetical protein
MIYVWLWIVVSVQLFGRGLFGNAAVRLGKCLSYFGPSGDYNIVKKEAQKAH